MRPVCLEPPLHHSSGGSTRSPKQLPQDVGVPRVEKRRHGASLHTHPLPTEWPRGSWRWGGHWSQGWSGWRAGHSLAGPLACCRFPVFPLKTHKYSSSSSDRHLTGAKPSEGDTQWTLASLVRKYRIFHSQKFSLGPLLTGAPVVHQRGDRGGLKTNSACCPTLSGETTPAETCVGGVDLP